jgi:hypothetical protein
MINIWQLQTWMKDNWTISCVAKIHFIDIFKTFLYIDESIYWLVHTSTITLIKYFYTNGFHIKKKYFTTIWTFSWCSVLLFSTAWTWTLFCFFWITWFGAIKMCLVSKIVLYLFFFQQILMMNNCFIFIFFLVFQ